MFEMANLGGILVNGCFSYHRFIFFIGLCRSLKYIIDPLSHAWPRLPKKFIVYCSTTLKSHSLRVSSFSAILVCSRAPQPVAQFSVYNDWRRRHTSNTSSYSIQSRGKQLFNYFAIANIWEKVCQIAILVQSIIPW